MSAFLRALPVVLLAAACLTAAPAPLERRPVRLTDGLSCVIRADAECELGKGPHVSVTITNHSKEAITLAYYLDGSTWKRRYPHTTFEILGPDGKSALKPIKHCKQVSQLSEQDFVLLRPGTSFDPFRRPAECREHPAYQLSAHTFDKPGKYRIRFTYSTANDDLAYWCGTSDFKLDALFRATPKLTLTSNEVVVEVKQK